MYMHTLWWNSDRKIQNVGEETRWLSDRSGRPFSCLFSVCALAFIRQKSILKLHLLKCSNPGLLILQLLQCSWFFCHFSSRSGPSYLHNLKSEGVIYCSQAWWDNCVYIIHLHTNPFRETHTPPGRGDLAKSQWFGYESPCQGPQFACKLSKKEAISLSTSSLNSL